MIAHSLNNLHSPEYHSCTSGREKAFTVRERICSSASLLPMIPSNIKRWMAGSMSSLVSMAENKVCNNCPWFMKRSSDSSSESPLIKSADRLDCRNSISGCIDSILTGSFSGLRVSLLPESIFFSFSDGQRSPNSYPCSSSHSWSNLLAACGSAPVSNSAIVFLCPFRLQIIKFFPARVNAT